MWDAVLNVNSLLWTLAFVFLIYALGAGILMREWKTFLIALLLFGFLTLTQIILGALAD